MFLCVRIGKYGSFLSTETICVNMCVNVFPGIPADVPMSSSNTKFSAVTGSARKIKDNAADWHNLMLKWDKLNNDGFQCATNIVNMRK